MNSSGANAGWCLICCSPCEKLESSINNQNSSTFTSSLEYGKNRLMTMKATEKIFEYLLVPKDHLEKVKKKCLLAFCPTCLEIMEEIIELQKQMEVLELKIQWNVETLGRIAIDKPGIRENCGTTQKQAAKIWKLFKGHVTRNFIKGLLPNPSVKIEKAVNIETKSTIKLGKVDHNSTFTNSNLLKSKCTNRKSNQEHEEEEDIQQLKEEEYDSNDDLFEEITVPVGFKNSIRRKETKEDNCKQKNSEEFENVQITNLKSEDKDCDDKNDESIVCKHEILDDNVFESLENRTNDNPYFYDTTNDEITLEDKIWLGDIDDDDAEEFNESLNDCPESNIDLNTATQVVQGDSQKLQEETSEKDKVESDISKNFQRLRPRRSVRPKTCCAGCCKSASEDELSNHDSTTSPKEKFDASETDSDFDPDSTRIRSNRRKMLTESVKLKNSIEKTNTFDMNLKTREPETEKLEGRDYYKCSKCDYIAKNERPSWLRRRIAEHYIKHHSLITQSDKSKTIDGKFCYQCTICSFSVVFETDTSSACHSSLQKMSLHYMEVHDREESQLNSNFHPEDKLISVKGGIDYFQCPIAICTFKAHIEKEGTPKGRLQNASRARLKIIEHYRTSPSHLEHITSTLSDIFNTVLVFQPEGVCFYKCTKCEFRSFVHQDISGNPRGTARKSLIVHYLHEHVFPWEIFPGLYKYGCYEDKSEDGTILKCPYLDCNYFIKIPYELEDKNENECQLVAYQSFVDHALSHNFNSVGFTNKTVASTQNQSTKDTFNVENFPNEIQDMPAIDDNKEEKISNSKRPLRTCVSKRLQVSDLDEDFESDESDNDFEFDFSSSSSESDCNENSAQPTDLISKPRNRVNNMEKFKGTKKTPTLPRELPEGLTEGKDFLKCPKCEFFTLSSSSYSQRKMQDTYDQKRRLRRKLAAHYAVHHIPIKDKALSKTPKGQDGYKCTKCNFYSTIIGAAASEKTFKSRYHALCLHYIDKHDVIFRENLPEGLTEGKDFLKCTKCDFFTLSSDNKLNKNVVEHKRNRRNLRRNLADHYATNHLPILEVSKTLDGENCYKCLKCSFNVIIGTDLTQQRIKRCLHHLSLHCVEIHDPFITEETPTDTNPADKLKNLIEAVDYYKCPEDTCTFYVMIDKEKTTGLRPEHLLRLQIVSHFNLCHNPELKNILLKPVLDEMEGTLCFRCSKCDFKSILESEKVESEARQRMKFHFNRNHTQPWKNFEGLYKFKTIEEKKGDEDIVKCSKEGCDFFVKVNNYLEGTSRERCRYKAHQAVRSHSRMHDLNVKAHNDKGYSNLYLPLYKGDRKFDFSLKPSSSVQLEEKKGTDVASDNLKETSLSLPICSEGAQTVVDASERTIPENNLNSSMAALSSATSLEIETEATDDIQSNNIPNLRRSKRTSAVKRKRYTLDDSGTSNETSEHIENSIDEERYRENEEEPDDFATAANSRSKKKCKMHENETQKSLLLDNSFETPKYPEKDHYRCWKCDFYIKVDYTKKQGQISACRFLARHKLGIHFNSTHNYEELAFHDPDKFLEVIEGKDCFRCPRCDHYEEIKFNPKTHADKIQGRKNARVNLGRHFFCKHSVPERPESPSEVDADIVILVDNKKSSKVSAEQVVEEQENTPDPKMCHLAPTEVLDSKISSFCKENEFF